MVLRLRAVAAATAVTPPRPRARASVAAHNRRCRSSRKGRRAANFARMVATSLMSSFNHDQAALLKLFPDDDLGDVKRPPGLRVWPQRAGAVAARGVPTSDARGGSESPG